MGLAPGAIRRLLIELDLITPERFDDVAKEAKRLGVGIEKVLVDQGLIMDKDLGQIVAGQFGLVFVDLSRESIASDVLNIIPEMVATKQQTVAFKQDKETLYLASANPEHFDFFKQLEKKTGRRVEVSYATPMGVQSAISSYGGDISGRVEKMLEQLKKNPTDEESVVVLVDLLLEYAYSNRASDIHLEPLTDVVSVRFRVDSVMHEVATYSSALHSQVVARIKIMAKLRTDEHAASQDGRFLFELESTSFDVRVSILPVTDGENIVMRLLIEGSRRLSLGDLGLVDRDLVAVKRGGSKSYGMVLVVGPTGSGKTTSLYAVLQMLNRPEVNIMTIEDPVEYDIEHVQQTQLNAAKKLTFATGLRAIVRQDPDIIMVGEIRDEETADIAVNSAMTGHLVLSTMHTNDAATTFPRMLEMGVQSFLVASSVHIVIAQRLVRRICMHCRVSFTLEDKQLKILESEPTLANLIKEVGGSEDIAGLHFYHGAGCNVCGDSGYNGRIGIFEVLEVTDAIRFLISKNAVANEISNKAKEEGMTTMAHDGITKMFKGETTLEEILRVTK